jgi:thiol-disulfide isomerase/thioredoxin
VRPLALAALVVGTAGTGAAAYVIYERLTQVSAPPPAPAESQPVRLAERIPAISLADRDGTRRSLDDWKGKSLIVNFWATWCAPCRREIPLLASLQQRYGPGGFQVIGIAADYRDKVLAYADETKIQYPLLIGEQDALDAAAAFGVEVIGLPFTVFSDSEGRIITCHVGELTDPVAMVILGAVERVNRSEASPAQARSEIAAGLARLKDEASRRS